jgi:predicted P-loop ATPase
MSQALELQPSKDNYKKVEVSTYQSSFSKKKGHYVPGGIPVSSDLYTELKKFKEGGYSDFISKLNSFQTNEEKVSYKQQHLPSVSFQCVCKNWREIANATHTGILIIEYDEDDNPEVDDWGKLRERLVEEMGIRLIACFLSARGKGLFLLLRIDPALHLKTFHFVSFEMKNQFGLNVDPSGKDITRLRFITYDPDGYINYDWDSIPVILPTAEYLERQREIKRITPRPKVAKVGKSDSSELFENAKRRAEYDYKIETGQDFQFTPGNRHRILVAIAGYCNVRGMDKNFLVDQINNTYHADGYDNGRAVDNVYKTYHEQHGTIDPNEQNEESIESLLFNYNLKRNVITRKIEINGKPTEQKDLNSIFLDIKKLHSKCSYDLIERTICSNLTPEYNPILEFIESNKEMRPTGAISRLIESVSSDTGFSDNEFFPQYAEHFFTKWYVGIIASIYGEHSPLMFVLCGHLQGTGKTEFWRRLLPQPLRGFFAESKLDAGKDDEILMTQKLLISDDEYGGKSKRDEKRIKEILSKDYFTLREPYGRFNVDLKRLAVLCGTTNDQEILSDPTGNRRIIPLSVLSIDHEKYNSVDKTEAFMEAYHLYKNGFNWRLNSEDIKRLNSNTEDFEQTSIERDMIDKFFRVPTKKDLDHNLSSFLTPTEMVSRIQLATGIKVSPTRFGTELRKMGFEKKAKKVSGVTIRQYSVVELSLVGGQVVSGLSALGSNLLKVSNQ